uniref:Thioredoxin domain-containing protein 12 n=1 Tax=Paramoeba aestuarina TaxID=180227 RepID=A0A7S4KHM2_9EUKA
MSRLLLCVLVALAVVGGAFCGEHGEAHGFNDAIDWWNDLDAAIEEIKSTKKPGLVIIHKSWCGACKNLKRAVDGPQGDVIVKASSDYVMINLADNAEPSNPEFSTDGKYIPRLYFIDTQGKVRTDLTAPGGNEKYKYYYSSPGQIERAMKQYLTKLV